MPLFPDSSALSRLALLALQAALALLLAGAPSAPAAAADPQVMLGDSCVKADGGPFDVPLILAGEDFRPSTLRVSILFDPLAVAPAPHRGRPVVTPGLPLEGTAVRLSFEADAEAGRVDVVLDSEGRRPLPPLPAGTLAHIHLRLQPQAQRDGVLRLDLDPGLVRSLDGRGAESFTAVAGPAYVWVGRTGPWLAVSGGSERTLIEAQGDLLRERAWIVRGRMTQLRRGGGWVTLGPLEPLPADPSGRRASDSGAPEPGEVFFYLAAQPDSAGRPMLGFGSSCRERMLALPTGGKDDPK